MKTAVIYNSKTGNTKLLAKRVSRELSANLYEMKNVELNILEKYDLIVIGSWIDKGSFNEQTVEFIKQIKDKKVAFFYTLGAYPCSSYTYRTNTAIIDLFEANNNTVLDFFWSQGSIDPQMISWMKSLDKEHPLAPDEFKVKRYADASVHPNDADLNNATSFSKNLKKRCEDV